MYEPDDFSCAGEKDWSVAPLIRTPPPGFLDSGIGSKSWREELGGPTRTRSRWSKAEFSEHTVLDAIGFA